MYGYDENPPANDTELVAAITLFQKASPEIQNALKLTPWELKFIGALPEIWDRYGTITWKQRREARKLVLKLHARLKRRAGIAAALKRVDPAITPPVASGCTTSRTRVRRP